MMVHEFCKKEGYCVKYIFQFARITAFCLAGEVLAAVLPLPIPASGSNPGQPPPAGMKSLLHFDWKIYFTQ